MKQLKREAYKSGHENNFVVKETRWDRIRKRCTGSSGSGAGTGAGSNPTFSLKTETVRRFIEADFIGKQNERLLHGEQDPRTLLNPALVMDIRHEMFQKIPRKLPLATVLVENQKIFQSCRAHNIVVEERFIDNELNKLRQQLENNRKRIEIKQQKENERKEDFLFVDNQLLMNSLEESSKHIEDFYTAPLAALTEVDQLCDFIDFEFEEDDFACEEKCEEKLEEAEKDAETVETQLEECKKLEKSFSNNDEENLKLAEAIELQVECRRRITCNKDESNVNDFVRRTPSPLTPTDEFLKSMREAAAKQQSEMRRVRFEDEVGQHEYKRENSTCSNTSEGLDSMISDLAEEALLELQMEEEQTEQTEQTEQVTVALNLEEKHDKEITNNIELKQLQEQHTSESTCGPLEHRPTLELIGEKASELKPNTQLLLIKPIKLPPRNVEKADPKHLKSELSSDDEAETVSTHEQNLIIEKLFQSRAQTNIVTLKKYFLKWIHYTTISKIERETSMGKNDRIQQINAFLDKIRREKVRISKMPKVERSTQEGGKGRENPPQNVQMTKKYQNKIKMQQDIIDLQRLKLERQERLIMELKLKKLSDEARDARQEIKNELKAVIRSGDAKAKAKAKCLQLIGNLRDAEDEDDFQRLQGKALLMPKFLKKMQERALERSIRHEQARQRRLQQEAEREALKIAAEEAKRLEDEEAKRMRIDALKEKRRQEKMAKVHKERERQRVVENNRKAHDFNRIRLLKRVGMEAFKRLLQRKQEYTRKSEILRRTVIRRAYFEVWRNFYQFEMSRRIRRADELYCTILKRKFWNIWKKFVMEERSKFYVAIDWYDMKLSTFMFKEWAEHTKRVRQVEEIKTRKAVSHFEWNLKFKVLDCWQRLPHILLLEKETEERRQRWRMKIWELLPDYTPRLDTFV